MQGPLIPSPCAQHRAQQQPLPDTAAAHPDVALNSHSPEPQGAISSAHPSEGGMNSVELVCNFSRSALKFSHPLPHLTQKVYFKAPEWHFNGASLYFCAFNKGPKSRMRAQTKAQCIFGVAGRVLLHSLLFTVILEAELLRDHVEKLLVCVWFSQ